MAIFYMDVKIIGRSSGRSATGAAAYRSGEKLRSNAVRSAAYGSGDKLCSRGIVHDYTKKKGVVHSEILLSVNAPEKYRDRETLWNAVELSEKRKDAQLAREIIVALPREFGLEEQIEVMREYVKENFVDKGMIADFAIHDIGADNPHAHIMLTMRHVSPDGFGLKNTDWNKKEILLSYRRAWTHIINRVLESKGLDKRIDHRSYREQGLDREPMIHLGYKAAALEKKGIPTERGEYNRKIIQRNECAKKEAIRMEIQELKKLRQALDNILESAENNVNADVLPTEVITKLKIINRMTETPQNVTTSENQPTTLTKEFTKKVSEKSSFLKMVKHRKEIREHYLTVRNQQRALETVRGEHIRERRLINVINEGVLEKAEDAKALHKHVGRLKTKHRKWRFLLSRKHKEALEQAIESAEGDLRIALYYFKDAFKIDLKDVPAESTRMKEQIVSLESAIGKLDAQISEISDKLSEIKQDFDKYKFRAKKREHPISIPEFDIMGRRNVTPLMQSLRRLAESERRRKKEKRRLRDAKPKKMRTIALSNEQTRPRTIEHSR